MQYDPVSLVKAVTDMLKAPSVDWKTVRNKPEVYTKDEVDELLFRSTQLTSPDGSKWVPTIDNTGKVMWKKVDVNATDNTTKN